MTSTKTTPLFDLGRVVATPGALDALRVGRLYLPECPGYTTRWRQP